MCTVTLTKKGRGLEDGDSKPKFVDLDSGCCELQTLEKLDGNLL